MQPTESARLWPKTNNPSLYQSQGDSIGLGLAAYEQGHKVRYVTCAQLVNELVEAADERVLSRVVARYGRLDLLLLDELGYV
jgi:DNA replication protein DnaC